MKAISTIWMLLLVLGLMVSPCYAIEYCKDFLESGNPGGWSVSLKTFDDEWTLKVGDEVELDIWINDVPLPLLSGGFWIEYDPSEVSIVHVQSYDGYFLPGPWEMAFTTMIRDPGGPGTYVVYVGPPLMGAAPDGDGDIIIAKVRFRCEGEGDATITISTIPGSDTFVGGDTTVFDSQIDPNAITVHQYEPPCWCEITGPDSVLSNGLSTETVQYEVSSNLQSCDNPPNYVWYDDCFLGDVDQTGLLSVPATLDYEDCTICVMDTANTDIVTGEPTECCKEILIEGDL